MRELRPDGYDSACCALMFLCALLGCSVARDRWPDIGDRMPPLATSTLEGVTTTLDSLRGKVVLLNVWATWCIPCLREVPELQALHTALASDGLQIVGVSIDAEGMERAVRMFVQAYDIRYPVWRDPARKVMRILGVQGVPASYLIDRGGVLRWRRLGPIARDDSFFMAALDSALRAGPMP